VLARMREGMKSKPVLSKLDDGTLMIKEIKWHKPQMKYLNLWISQKFC
jgi:hypothetical protein